MNRKWNGFLPQNELVKLQWAALEESQSSRACERLSVVLQLLGAVQATQNEPEDNDDEPALQTEYRRALARKF
jgi:hypothetical protein